MEITEKEIVDDAVSTMEECEEPDLTVNERDIIDQIR